MKLDKEYVLVEWNGNWADEMDLNGFKVCEKRDWDKYVKTMDNVTFPETHCVGTNEDLEWETKEDHLDEFKARKITSEQYQTIKKLIGVEFGFFPDLSYKADYEGGYN